MAIIFGLFYIGLVLHVSCQQIELNSRETELHNLALSIGGGGLPEVDFPILSSIPKTSFSCINRNPGYHADTSLESRCQVFYICQEGGRSNAFLCPNGTLFNEDVSICDWWYNVDCTSDKKEPVQLHLISNPEVNVQSSPKKDEDEDIDRTSFGKSLSDQTKSEPALIADESSISIQKKSKYPFPKGLKVNKRKKPQVKSSETATSSKNKKVSESEEDLSLLPMLTIRMMDGMDSGKSDSKSEIVQAILRLLSRMAERRNISFTDNISKFSQNQRLTSSDILFHSLGNRISKSSLVPVPKNQNAFEQGLAYGYPEPTGSLFIHGNDRAQNTSLKSPGEIEHETKDDSLITIKEEKDHILTTTVGTEEELEFVGLVQDFNENSTNDEPKISQEEKTTMRTQTKKPFAIEKELTTESGSTEVPKTLLAIPQDQTLSIDNNQPSDFPQATEKVFTSLPEVDTLIEDKSLPTKNVTLMTTESSLVHSNVPGKPEKTIAGSPNILDAKMSTEMLVNVRTLDVTTISGLSEYDDPTTADPFSIGDEINSIETSTSKIMVIKDLLKSSTTISPKKYDYPTPKGDPFILDTESRNISSTSINNAQREELTESTTILPQEYDYPTPKGDVLVIGVESDSIQSTTTKSITKQSMPEPPTTFLPKKYDYPAPTGPTFILGTESDSISSTTVQNIQREDMQQPSTTILPKEYEYPTPTGDTFVIGNELASVQSTTTRSIRNQGLHDSANTILAKEYDYQTPPGNAFVFAPESDSILSTTIRNIEKEDLLEPTTTILSKEYDDPTPIDRLKFVHDSSQSIPDYTTTIPETDAISTTSTMDVYADTSKIPTRSDSIDSSSPSTKLFLTTLRIENRLFNEKKSTTVKSEIREYDYTTPPGEQFMHEQLNEIKGIDDNVTAVKLEHTEYEYTTPASTSSSIEDSESSTLNIVTKDDETLFEPIRAEYNYSRPTGQEFTFELSTRASDSNEIATESSSNEYQSSTVAQKLLPDSFDYDDSIARQETTSDRTGIPTIETSSVAYNYPTPSGQKLLPGELSTDRSFDTDVTSPSTQSTVDSNETDPVEYNYPTPIGQKLTPADAPVLTSNSSENNYKSDTRPREYDYPTPPDDIFIFDSIAVNSTPETVITTTKTKEIVRTEETSTNEPLEQKYEPSTPKTVHMKFDSIIPSLSNVLSQEELSTDDMTSIDLNETSKLDDKLISEEMTSKPEDYTVMEDGIEIIVENYDYPTSSKMKFLTEIPQKTVPTTVSYVRKDATARPQVEFDSTIENMQMKDLSVPSFTSEDQTSRTSSDDDLNAVKTFTIDHPTTLEYDPVVTSTESFENNLTTSPVPTNTSTSDVEMPPKTTLEDAMLTENFPITEVVSKEYEYTTPSGAKLSISLESLSEPEIVPLVTDIRKENSSEIDQREYEYRTPTGLILAISTIPEAVTNDYDYSTPHGDTLILESLANTTTTAPTESSTLQAVEINDTTSRQYNYPTPSGIKLHSGSLGIQKFDEETFEKSGVTEDFKTTMHSVDDFTDSPVDKLSTKTFSISTNLTENTTSTTLTPKSYNYPQPTGETLFFGTSTSIGSTLMSEEIELTTTETLVNGNSVTEEPEFFVRNISSANFPNLLSTVAEGMIFTTEKTLQEIIVPADPLGTKSETLTPMTAADLSQNRQPGSKPMTKLQTDIDYIDSYDDLTSIQGTANDTSVNVTLDMSTEIAVPELHSEENDSQTTERILFTDAIQFTSTPAPNYNASGNNSSIIQHSSYNYTTPPGQELIRDFESVLPSEHPASEIENVSAIEEVTVDQMSENFDMTPEISDYSLATLSSLNNQITTTQRSNIENNYESSSFPSEDATDISLTTPEIMATEELALTVNTSVRKNDPRKIGEIAPTENLHIDGSASQFTRIEYKSITSQGDQTDSDVSKSTQPFTESTLNPITESFNATSSFSGDEEDSTISQEFEEFDDILTSSTPIVIANSTTTIEKDEIIGNILQDSDVTETPRKSTTIRSSTTDIPQGGYEYPTVTNNIFVHGETMDDAENPITSSFEVNEQDQTPVSPSSFTNIFGDNGMMIKSDSYEPSLPMNSYFNNVHQKPSKLYMPDQNSFPGMNYPFVNAYPFTTSGRPIPLYLPNLKFNPFNIWNLFNNNVKSDQTMYSRKHSERPSAPVFYKILIPVQWHGYPYDNQNHFSKSSPSSQSYLYNNQFPSLMPPTYNSPYGPKSLYSAPSNESPNHNPNSKDPSIINLKIIPDNMSSHKSPFVTIPPTLFRNSDRMGKPKIFPHRPLET